MQGDGERRKDTLIDIELMIEDETDSTYQSMKKEILDKGDQESLGELVTMLNQMTLLEETKKLRLLYKRKSVHSATFKQAVTKFETWLCLKRQVFSEQESQDAQTETVRLKHWLALLVFSHLVCVRDVSLPPRLDEALDSSIKRMKDGHLHTESQRQTTSDLLKELAELVPESGLGVSEEERVMIVKAMGLNQGHWFKCPEGHIYAIADCGGATMESRCPDCLATIGGTQHRVRDDNNLAPEMDGATRPAWPTALDNVDHDVLDLDALF